MGSPPRRDSLEYLQGAALRAVTGIDSSSDTFNETTIPGDRVPEAPEAQTFWTDKQVGTDVTVSWPVSDGDTTLVVMDEGGSRAVAADISVLVTVAWAGSLGIGLIIAALVLLGVAIAVLVAAFRAGSEQPAQQWPTGT